MVKIKFQHSKTYLRFLITVSKDFQVNIEVFNINFLRSIIKCGVKPWYNKKRFQTVLKRGTGRKKTNLNWFHMLRVFNILIVTTKTKTIQKYRYRKMLKRMGYLSA